MRIARLATFLWLAVAVAAIDDYYEMLGVSPQAERSEIRRAYYALAKEHHPDKNKGADEELFRRIGAAYEVLSDEEERKRYDKKLEFYLRTGHDAPNYGKDIYESTFTSPYGTTRYVDPTVFLVCLVIFVSGAQYAHRFWRYKTLQESAKKTEKYKMAQRLAAADKQKGGKNKKKKEAEEEEQPEVEFTVVGAERPEVLNMFAFALFTFPLTLLYWSIAQFKFYVLKRRLAVTALLDHPAKIEGFMNQLARAKLAHQKMTLESLKTQNYFIPNSLLREYGLPQYCEDENEDEEFEEDDDAEQETPRAASDAGRDYAERARQHLKQVADEEQERAAARAQEAAEADAAEDAQEQEPKKSIWDKREEAKDSGPWTREEESQLAKAVKKYPGGTVDRWQQVASFVGTRSADECASKMQSFKIPSAGHGASTDSYADVKQRHKRKGGNQDMPEADRRYDGPAAADS